MNFSSVSTWSCTKSTNQLISLNENIVIYLIRKFTKGHVHNQYEFWVARLAVSLNPYHHIMKQSLNVSISIQTKYLKKITICYQQVILENQRSKVSPFRWIENEFLNRRSKIKNDFFRNDSCPFFVPLHDSKFVIFELLNAEFGTLTTKIPHSN